MRLSAPLDQPFDLLLALPPWRWRGRGAGPESGQPELAEKIGRFPSLKSRLVSSSLTEMTRGDIERMIRFRWTVAAGGGPKAKRIKVAAVKKASREL